MDYEARRDPDAILRQIVEEEAAEGDTRGKLKIFFGYAAGVGKTYAMLEEAHAVLEKGFDVVVGYVEPHTRADTMALVDGLEQISPSTVQHRGISLREFDLDAVLARHPQIVLVDELAHTNAPGCRHRKRYQDVEELLRAGINVFTTVNVQHLEGLNDKIAAITHVSVAERIPDRIFDQAASVELVDIEPDDLIERLEAGKIYLPDRARTALGNFFSRKNLAALREIALRRMADRLTRKAECTEAGARVEAGEDVLVYVTHNTGNVKAIRAAANMAESYHGALTAVVVESSQSKKFDSDQRGRLRANIDLAEELGAHVVTLFGDDIAQQLAQYAVTAGATHIVVGNATGGLSVRSLLRESLVSRLMKLAHGAVVDVVPTKDLPAQYGRLSEATGFRLTGADVWRALASVAIATAIGLAIYSLGLAGSVVLMLYLIVALLIATRADGFFYALFVSMGSVFAYNFFFTIPRFTLHAVGLNYPIIFAFLLVGTFAASSLAIRMKRQAESTARRAYRMEVLLESSRKLQGARNADECFRLAAEQVIKLLNRPVVMYRLGIDGRLAKPVVHDVPGTLGGDAGACALASPEESAVAAWSAANNERAGATTDTLADSQCLYLPIHSKDAVFGVAGIAMDDIDGEEDFGAFEKNLLLAILDECGQTTEQIVFAEDRRRMEMRMEKETLRANLLRTISHDLRTPLTSISGHAFARSRRAVGAAEGALVPRHPRRRVLAGHARGEPAVHHAYRQRHAAAGRTARAGGGCREGGSPARRSPRWETPRRRGVGRRAAYGRHGCAFDRAGDHQPGEQRGIVHAGRRAHSRERAAGRGARSSAGAHRGCRRRPGHFRGRSQAYLRHVLQWLHRPAGRKERRFQARHGLGLVAMPFHRRSARRHFRRAQCEPAR